MAAKRATILDVAERAGVSTTTVSDALRGRGRISSATKAAVEQAAADIGYVPNRAARSLRIAEFGVIGLHLPETLSRSEFYMSTTFGVLEQCSSLDYDVTLISSKRAAAPPDVDGVIVVDPLTGDAGLPRILQLAAPVVTMERILGVEREAALVTADYESATVQLLELLASAGAQRIGLLSAIAETDWAQRVRREYEQWCESTGRESHIALHSVLSPDDTWVAGAEGLLDAGCDAVLCGPPVAAHALLVAANTRALVIGSDLGMACVVDAPSLASAVPPVTSVDLKPRESGRASVDLLVGILRGQQPKDARVPIPATLVERASTGTREQ
ncbi:LacI family DNA-binding transcriptional regulator [uncultured Agrococcus sp.]|uniref:LacI family DNA-binding transcriptional regulator n=1 Tax=uncultured Agrococcus sp. TaxID=382258 RepID=UPI0025E42161|nr:LacI family DNA-binding transcriptional regulator [uncultured Agrococcus sp.]